MAAPCRWSDLGRLRGGAVDGSRRSDGGGSGFADAGAGGAIRSARVVLGQVAPVPWVSHDAAEALVGKTPSEELAAHAADVAVSRATPLSENEYKVQVARAAVKRAIVRAVERAVQREGGLA